MSTPSEKSVHEKESHSIKCEKLGICAPGPMSSTTVSVQGLSSNDAVEIVRRKLQRARQASAAVIKVLILPGDTKTLRKLESFLAAAGGVREFQADAHHSGTFWIHLDQG